LISFLHLADLHLGWQPNFSDRELGVEIGAERDGFLKAVVDFALDPENKIDLVIIAGDLFESHRPVAKVIGQVMKELTRLVRGGIQLVTVPGNHDEITYPDSVYRQEQNRWPGFLVTNPSPQLSFRLDVNRKQVFVYSLAYTGGITGFTDTLKDFPREKEEGFHLAIFHGSYIDGDPGWELGTRSLPLDAKSLEQANYDYVALGHFHSHRVFQFGKGIGAYAGAIADKGFNDLGTGFLLKGIWRQNMGVQLERIPLTVKPKFEKLEIDLSRFNNSDELLSAVEELGRPDAVMQVELKGMRNFLFEPKNLRERLLPFFRYVEIIDQSFFLSAAELEKMAREKTITGFFLRGMLEKLKEAVTDEQKRLLNRALVKGIQALKGGDKS